MSSHKAEDEALAILEEEAKQRIEDIRQRIEFACTTLRAQGNTQINQLLLSVRQLTMQEFCHLYGADTAVFLQANQKRLRQRPEPVRLKRKTAVVINSKSSPAQTEPITKTAHATTAPSLPAPPPTTDTTNTTEKTATGSTGPFISSSSSTSSSAAVPSSTRTEVSAIPTKRKRPREASAKTSTKDFGPMFVHLERKNHPRIAFTLDPQQSVDTLGSFSLHMPQAELFDEMDAHQRENLRGQVRDIRRKLDTILDQL